MINLRVAWIIDPVPRPVLYQTRPTMSPWEVRAVGAAMAGSVEVVDSQTVVGVLGHPQLPALSARHT